MDVLAQAIERRRANYVVDGVIRKFFGMVDQSWVIRNLEYRIAVQRVLGLVVRF